MPSTLPYAFAAKVLQQQLRKDAIGKAHVWHTRMQASFCHVRSFVMLGWQLPMYAPQRYSELHNDLPGRATCGKPSCAALATSFAWQATPWLRTDCLCALCSCFGRSKGLMHPGNTAATQCNDS